MKKSILSTATIIGCAMLTSCGLGTAGIAYNPQANSVSKPTASTQTTGADMLGTVLNQAASGSSILSNIISTFAPGITTNKNTIVGTWNYSKPCVQFESESFLAQAGGSVAATKTEEKLASIYQFAGIKPGACTFVFGTDDTVQYTIGGNTHTGKYSFDTANKTVTITTQAGLQVTSFVSIAGNNMGLTFDVSKLLALAGSASTMLNGTLATVIGNYKGMKLGFEFTK